ncbi:hypothetical protein [Novosphingobium rosa]|uniref:hypothetical protein n=1 Tax=Novosphingobium rosa TaxID=76978 RepID=UPI000831FB83|nr:hypothetical protein [Novosphingobium rosa]
MVDLTQFDALPQNEQVAFLAFFAGARGNLQVSRRGDTGEEFVGFGKAECEWVPFREFWQHKLPALGWTTFQESEPSEARGMLPGSTFTRVQIRATDLGRSIRDGYWERFRQSRSS